MTDNMGQTIVGIDYSMSCPSVTWISKDLPFKFENCHIAYLSEKVAKSVLPNIHPTRLGKYENNEHRFDMISMWALDHIPRRATVFIEDYSFGSKGKVFHIAENAGLVKHKLWKLGHNITPIAPTVIKKFATGKGNATKEQMYEVFVNETGVKLLPLYQPKSLKVGSPVGDIVDSYFICKYGYFEA